MKKTKLFAVLALAATPAFLHAQTTSYSDIVGYQTTTVPVGLSGVGFPLLNSDLLKVSATSLSGNSLSLSGQSNVGALLSSGEPYYLEVYSGTLKGDRFDVNTAATITAANGTVVLDGTSANNTYAVASIASQLDGVTVALRKHITVEQIGQMAAPSLIGNNQAAQADQIQVYDSANNSYTTYFLRGDNLTWRVSGTTTIANKFSIPPGAGCFIKRGGSTPTTITSTGTVRQNDFAFPLKSGLQLVAPGFPIPASPTDLGGSGANGWTGNNQAAQADQLQTYDSQNNSYVVYFLRGDNTSWRISGTTTVVTSNNVVADNQAFFIKKTVAAPDYVINNKVSQ